MERRINYPLSELNDYISACLNELRSCYSKKYEYRAWVNSFLPQISKDYDKSLSLYENKLRFYVNSCSDFINNFSSQIIDTFLITNSSDFSRISKQLKSALKTHSEFSRENFKNSNLDFLKNSFNLPNPFSSVTENSPVIPPFVGFDFSNKNLSIDLGFSDFGDFSSDNYSCCLEEDPLVSENLKDSLEKSPNSDTSNVIPFSPLTIDDLNQISSLTKVFSFQSTIDILKSNGFTKSRYILKRFIDSNFSFFLNNSYFSSFIDDLDFNEAWEIILLL